MKPRPVMETLGGIPDQCSWCSPNKEKPCRGHGLARIYGLNCLSINWITASSGHRHQLAVSQVREKPPPFRATALVVAQVNRNGRQHAKKQSPPRVSPGVVTHNSTP